jgi:3-hydroxyacyl-[acyl-carrier-protein] dehydratase
VAATGELAVAGRYFPPVLLVEAMAQLGGIAAGQRQGEGGVLAALNRVELPLQVPPDARFSLHSKVVKNFGRLILIEGEVREEGQVVASATLTLAIGEG